MSETEVRDDMPTTSHCSQPTTSHATTTHANAELTVSHFDEFDEASSFDNSESDPDIKVYI